MNSLVRFGIKIGALLLTGYLLLHFVFGMYRVPDQQNYPGLREGDLVITCRIGEIRSGDVIAYHRADGKPRFGRVAACGEDTVELLDGQVSVNGTISSETLMYETKKAEDAAVSYPYLVPKNAFFVLNDYRPDAGDSRSFGAVRRERTDGKLIFVLRRRNF